MPQWVRLSEWLGVTVGYLYFAAVINSLNVSHHTITAKYFAGSTPFGTGTTKLWNVFTSPTRIIADFSRLKSDSVSTNSGDKYNL